MLQLIDNDDRNDNERVKSDNHPIVSKGVEAIAECFSLRKWSLPRAKPFDSIHPIRMAPTEYFGI